MSATMGNAGAPKRRSRKWWIIAGILAVPAAVVGGPYVYIHFISGDAPAPLTISTSTPPGGATTGEAVPVEGTWNVSSGSQAGYRVKELLFGQSNEAVGRTSNVTGSLTISGTRVTTASFTVDLASVRSDESRRDNQFRGRIMNVATYPTATFTLTEPIQLGAIPAEGVEGTATATGELTLHGTTKTVVVTITGKRTGATIQVSGSIPITFADWNIPNPSGGPASTEDHGSIEFLLNFTRS